MYLSRQIGGGAGKLRQTARLHSASRNCRSSRRLVHRQDDRTIIQIRWLGKIQFEMTRLKVEQGNMCFNDNESTPLSQAVAVGVDELQSAPSFARSVKVNEDGLVDVLETPLESPNSPVYIRPRGVVEAPAVGYYSMHRQDDRTIIQINWLGKSKVSEIFCCLGVLVFTTYFAIFSVPGANTFSEGFTLSMRIFYATLMCCAVYLLACLFFNSVYITITRDGVKVDERPLKRYGFPRRLVSWTRRGCLLNLWFNFTSCGMSITPCLVALKLFTVSTSWMATNSQCRCCRYFLVKPNTRLYTLFRKSHDTCHQGRAKQAL